VHPTRLISPKRSKDQVFCVAEEDIDGPRNDQMWRLLG
jgi:hypothetical protein